VKEIEEAKAKGEPRPPHSEDYEIGCIVLDFLFASQDASTASLTWCLDLLPRHPDVFQKLRAEQDQMRPKREGFTTELVADMQYTYQVMKEILRHRPPATIVPHIAAEDYQISDDYRVPKGSLVVPSVWSANKQGFTDGEKFDPDRFSKERQEDKKFE